MASRLLVVLRNQSLMITGVRAMSGGQFGDGAGKGGGSGGAIREAGGSFGKMEATKEEQYFRQLQKEQIEKIKEMLEDEVSHHESQIRQHQAILAAPMRAISVILLFMNLLVGLAKEAIEYHKKNLHRIHKRTKDGSDSD